MLSDSKNVRELKKSSPIWKMFANSKKFIILKYDSEFGNNAHEFGKWLQVQKIFML